MGAARDIRHNGRASLEPQPVAPLMCGVPNGLLGGRGGGHYDVRHPKGSRLGVLRTPSPLPTVRAISHIAYRGHARPLSCSWQQ